MKIHFFVILSFIIIFIILTKNNTYAEPILKDSSLRAELVVQGIHSPTSMAFLDENHILVLEKNSGNVLLVSKGDCRNSPY